MLTEAIISKERTHTVLVSALLMLTPHIMLLSSLAARTLLHSGLPKPGHPFPFICWDNYKNLSGGRGGFFRSAQAAWQIESPL